MDKYTYKSGVISKCPKCNKENETNVTIYGAVYCSNCDYAYSNEDLEGDNK